MAEDEEARCQGEDEGFKVLVRAVASAADIGGGEETEDVLRRLWELPELESRCLVSARRFLGGYVPPYVGVMPGNDGAQAQLTEVQYGSSAGIWRSSASRKMPFLKTSFESLAPILASFMGLPSH